MDVGLDRLPSHAPLLARLRGSRVGLLAHPASVDRGMVHAAEVLHRAGVRPAIFFGPEHGYGGEAQDMVGVASAVDARTGAPIVSLYGDAFTDLAPRAEHLAGLEVLLVDLADVGARYYTFVWTALLALRAAHRAGVQVVLLDRPNPIGGLASRVEGATQRDGFLSFVGLEPVPVRHALSVGEILARCAERDGLSLGAEGALAILPARGWDRARTASAWDRPFVLPSPNMPTVDTALVYPGGCLIEGTNLSEGRGTTRPFEIVGAPWIDGHALARGLAATGLVGFVARPTTFRPTFQKHAGALCGGVQIHVTDEAAFRPVATYVALTALARAADPARFRFRTERYEYVDDIPAFDLLTGSAEARLAIEAGGSPREVAQPRRRGRPRLAGGDARRDGGGGAGCALEDVERVGAVRVRAARHRLAQLVVVAGEVVHVLPEPLLRGGREDGGEVDLAPGAVLPAALDGAGGARQARGDGVEIDGHVGDALLRELHLGDVAPVLAQHVLRGGRQLAGELLEDDGLAREERVRARHPLAAEHRARLADGEVAEQPEALDGLAHRLDHLGERLARPRPCPRAR